MISPSSRYWLAACIERVKMGSLSLAERTTTMSPGCGTARGSMTGKDYTDFTRNQLDSWGCKYHDLTMGVGINPKPHFDLVIDDKAKRIEEL